MPNQFKSLNDITMARGKNQYVVPTQGGWGVRSESCTQ